MVKGVEGKREGSILSRLDTFQKIVAAAGAVIAVWGGYVTAQTSSNADELQQIQSRLDTLKEERQWAKELYARFDQIVSQEADEQARIDRLAGLLALTELTDQDDLKAQWALLIKQQAGRYSSALQAKPSRDPGVQAQLQQYRDLQSQAAATVRQAKPSWRDYDFDIFWCPGERNRVLAEAIRGLKATDPAAKGNWRLRQIPANHPQVADKKELAIVWDYEDERPLADALAAGISKLRSEGVELPQLKLMHSINPSSRWYLSIFVCRS